MIEDRYPGAERIARVDCSRTRQVLTNHKNPYPAKKFLTQPALPPPCVLEFPRSYPPRRHIQKRDFNANFSTKLKTLTYTRGCSMTLI